MSRAKRRKGRVRGAEPSTTITLSQEVGDDATLTIVGLSDADVAEARRQVAAGNLHHPLVVRIVAALLRALGLDPNGHKWTAAEYVQLLELLGFSPFTWSQVEDDELAQLLAEGGGERD
ncbi:hypothetical protein [Streptomyces chartreusis]|uniref:hypothetical protein n=1 Tax=Streptomyces chartreusis TaxID=1969 RepID=UPI0036644AE7